MDRIFGVFDSKRGHFRGLVTLSPTEKVGTCPICRGLAKNFLFLLYEKRRGQLCLRAVCGRFTCQRTLLARGIAKAP